MVRPALPASENPGAVIPQEPILCLSGLCELGGGLNCLHRRLATPAEPCGPADGPAVPTAGGQGRQARNTLPGGGATLTACWMASSAFPACCLAASTSPPSLLSSVPRGHSPGPVTHQQASVATSPSFLSPPTCMAQTSYTPSQPHFSEAHRVLVAIAQSQGGVLTQPPGGRLRVDVSDRSDWRHIGVSSGASGGACLCC